LDFELPNSGYCRNICEEEVTIDLGRRGQDLEVDEDLLRRLRIARFVHVDGQRK
jgi:hypothetical protein